MSMKGNMFGALSDDVILKILYTLEDDPRHWATLACVSTRFRSLITTSCWKSLCRRTIPSDLLPSSSETTEWASLHKLTVCCPGPIHAGLLLETSDFGLQRELGPDLPIIAASAATSIPSNDVVSSDSGWSLFDDLYFDTIYNPSEVETETAPESHHVESHQPPSSSSVVEEEKEEERKKKRKVVRSSHLASGTRNLSREQGSKLLARQFRDDWLYICEWPGCVHVEEKRNYRLFRGVFKNFKKSRVWRTINDGNRKKIDLGCAFCDCDETWDMLSAFCLRRGFGYHDDGEPVVRAFVCENGHVSGAWTDVPIYT
ncbi:hypothetical protein PIB30_055396 [Stylosanthes scabra]|uniref:Phytochrome A-associated F-box protein n=1 Tax=Stylosanthes scabra TaxID=79078 RepID=A0ABU6VHJ5_9FABA|nr:hypothetical protein [Stylosanthes scabra]